ncbi:MAG TPA: hypothetical protein VHO84_15205, partial [Syntrophorhabdaceae bacterium]|nr:hypothetical protein [Syntrophorhabdaceae bacterium]
GNKSTAIEEAYFRLDMPFRTWIVSIDPQVDDISAKMNEWKEQMKSIILHLAQEIVREASDKAFVGTILKRNNREEIMSAPKAYLKFKSGIHYLTTR